ncbi:hypothetical protein P692DRAFT_201852623 [Suillus brevipes Sb2]|nr:hypothetical protein P692DRAFT_201852623 [Suillus brevipes Sb2]
MKAITLSLQTSPVVAGAIPFAGPPIQATISGLLSILQSIDRRSQNKGDLDRLASRLHRLSSHLCNAPTAQDPSEQHRRDSIIGILQETSAQLARLQERRLEYASVTQTITGCSIEIDRYLLESLWSFQLQQHQNARGTTMTQLSAAVTLGCVTLVDATGHKHPISVTFCTSFQQLNEMLQVLFKRDPIEAQLQRRYMEQGQYDLCIDDDRQVTRLTSQGWPIIEAGTTIVMRVVVEQKTYYGADYKCHFCGTANRSDAKRSLQHQANCSINCRVCQRRFQVSCRSLSAKPSTQYPVPRTEMHLIRNFHIQQTVCCHETSLVVLD